MTNFAVFILSNRRPDNVLTYDTLRRCGYTGKIYIIVDDLDPTINEYKKKYGKEVIVFDKKKVAETFDRGDNFNDLRSVIYARNASFDIAKKLKLEYFLQLDDDYRGFQWRFGDKLTYSPKAFKNFDDILKILLNFFKNTNASSLCISQGGDFIGGEDSTMAKTIWAKRKAMNFFLLSVKRPFKFVGILNDDVNTYVSLGSKGNLFFMTNQLSLEQVQTQQNEGGLTEIYLDSGTYVKSFYSILFNPSSVKISVLNDRKGARVHHRINWRNTVPKILRDHTSGKTYESRSDESPNDASDIKTRGSKPRRHRQSP